MLSELRIYVQSKNYTDITLEWLQVRFVKHVAVTRGILLLQCWCWEGDCAPSSHHWMIIDIVHTQTRLETLPGHGSCLLWSLLVNTIYLGQIIYLKFIFLR